MDHVGNSCVMLILIMTNLILLSVKNVEIHGIQYRLECVLRIVDMDESGERDYPSYGKLEEILIWQDQKFFVLVLLKTIEFTAHLMSYKVLPTKQKLMVHGVMNMILKDGDLFVVEKESSAIEDTFI